METIRVECPYPECKTTVALPITHMSAIQFCIEDSNRGYQIAYGYCPHCKRIIIVMSDGLLINDPSEPELAYAHHSKINERIIFPVVPIKTISSEEVPKEYRDDFNESACVLPYSPKASAAISRRILQTVLANELKISDNSLLHQIEKFIILPNVPPHLSKAVDAIRNIGNIAAHPQKDVNTGSIVDVEPCEAEWLLEVIESLFDFIFIQPKKLEKQRQSLNDKLQRIGKPPML